MSMGRREFLGSAAAAAAAAGFRAEAQTLKPNLVFILADDLGYGDLGCYGQKRIETPNLDRMAAEGMRFTQAYSGSTVCAPSRCALMTGKHTGHCTIRGNKRPEQWMMPGEQTVADVMKKAGYRTGIFGKWGLGGAGTNSIPNRRGFDEWFGYLDQLHAHTYYPTHLWENEREYFLTGNFGNKRHQYSPDLIFERSTKWLDQAAKDPFFLYLAFTLPHANNELNRESGNGNEVPDDAPYSGRDWPQPDKNFAAMVTRLDRYIGQVFAQLKRLGVDENTLVVFASDNGAHREGGNRPEFFDSNGPLRGIKRDLYEGGIRTPAMARWPGVIQPGQVSDAVWAFWDLLPTAADLAGVKAPAGLDGVSFLPALRGKPMAPREYLYWEFHERGFSQAARMGDWKAVRNRSRRNPVELYDLKTDIGEERDVAAKHPDIVKKMERILAEARSESKEFPVTEASGG